MSNINITGFVLAGGKSSRMGTDKSLMFLNGKTLIQYAIDVIAPICNKVVISSNEFVYDFLGCEVWPDALKAQAPLVGIYSCLKNSPSETNIFLSCDMPMLVTPFFEHLFSVSENYDIIIPIHDDNLMEPLCGIYRKSALPIIERFISDENYRLYECIKATNFLAVNIDQEATFFNKNLFFNINSVSDFNEISEIP